jgi:hypothetical protein
MFFPCNLYQLQSDVRCNGAVSTVVSRCAVYYNQQSNRCKEKENTCYGSYYLGSSKDTFYVHKMKTTLDLIRKSGKLPETELQPKRLRVGEFASSMVKLPG